TPRRRRWRRRPTTSSAAASRTARRIRRSRCTSTTGPFSWTPPAARCRWRSDPFRMLRLYNTLSRQEEPFAPARDNTVRMYACGLTVYNRGHIGNFRTFVCLDVLRRTLKYLCNHHVRGVLNYTDVDDKTIAGAAKAGTPLRDYTDQWIQVFRE